MDNCLDEYEKERDEKHPLINLDEKTFQLLAEAYPAKEAKPGMPLLVDSEYKRKGTAAMFVMVEPATGRTAVSVRKRRTSKDFAEVVAYVADVMYPKAEEITIMLDNLNTHTENSIRRRFGKKKAERILKRVKFVYTPKHGSWVNVAEGQISIIARQCLTRRIDSLDTLRNKMRLWVRMRNKEHKNIHWKFSKTDARKKLSHLYALYPEEITA